MESGVYRYRRSDISLVCFSHYTTGYNIYLYSRWGAVRGKGKGHMGGANIEFETCEDRLVQREPGGEKGGGGKVGTKRKTKRWCTGLGEGENQGKGPLPNRTKVMAEVLLRLPPLTPFFGSCTFCYEIKPLQNLRY